MMTQKEILQTLKRPIQVGLAAGFITAIISLFIPNQYTSEGRLLPVSPKKANNNLGGLAAAAASFGVNIGSDDSSSTYVDILKSRWVCERLLNEEFTFTNRTWYFAKPKPRKARLLDVIKAKNIDRGIAQMQEILQVQRDLKTGLITLKATAPSPELSQGIAQKAINLLDHYIQTQSKTQSIAKAEFTGQRLKEAQAGAIIAEKAFRDFLQENRNYLNTPDPKIRLCGIRLEAEYTMRRQLVSNLAISYEQSLIDQKDDMPIINVLDGGNLPIEKSRPKRSLFVAYAFILAGALAWCWPNRTTLKRKIAQQFAPPNEA